jgi:acetyl esterase
LASSHFVDAFLEGSLPARASVTSRVKQLRRTVGRRVLERMYLHGAALADKLPHAKPERYGVQVLRDVPYLHSGLADHTLDVYRPVDAGSHAPLPLVIYMHGGGFYSLSKDTHAVLALSFARRGMVVVVPNYRLAPKHRFPAHLEDAAEALRFAVANAKQWGADPDHVIFAGESAGANLVTSMTLCLAYGRREPYARVMQQTGVYPRMVLAASGVFEVANGHRFAERYPNMSWFFDDRYRELEELYAPHVGGKPLAHDLINPLHLVEREAPHRDLPPFFLPVGSLDHLKDDTARMATALRAHGADVEAPVYSNGLHAFHAFVVLKAAQQCWEDHFRFMRARGTPVREPRVKIGFGLR